MHKHRPARHYAQTSFVVFLSQAKTSTVKKKSAFQQQQTYLVRGLYLDHKNINN